MFPVVSLYLEAAIMVAVVCPYAIMTGIFINSATTFSLLLSYSVMVTFFNVGQAFVNKVGRVWLCSII